MITRVAVIVPAADEQDRIGACLGAIALARQRLLESDLDVDRVDLAVVLDGCRDGTAAIVAQFAATSGVRAIRSTARCVGAARRLGAAAALSRSGSPGQLWLANTDADSKVPANWLVRMVRAANAGAQVVLGTVLPGAELPRAVRLAWLAQHQLGDGHPHVHGANLGIRADTYVSLGGWPPIPFDEDVELAARAAARGFPIVRAADIPVITSARMAGRAPNGFSSYLRHLRAGQRAQAGAKLVRE